MVYHGRVQNGVIVLSQSAGLSEGHEVAVVVPEVTAKHEDGAPSVLTIAPVSLGSVLDPWKEGDILSVFSCVTPANSASP